MIRLLHIVNPVARPTSDPLGYAQEISFVSMIEARRLVPRGLQVVSAAAYYDDEKVDGLDFFTYRFLLSRSVYDVERLPLYRRLPLIADIMAFAKTVPADYYLYTNIDISLQPHFYSFLWPYLLSGYEGLIVNRRRIPRLRGSYSDLSSYSSRWGRSHPGFDCFLMSASVVERLVLGKICIGVPFVGVAMAHNIFAHARPWRLFTREDLTFHIGTEIYKPQLHSYYWHNRRQFFKKVRPKLWPLLSAKELPYGREIWWKKYWYWGLNPSLFVYMNMKLCLRDLLLEQRGRR